MRPYSLEELHEKSTAHLDGLLSTGEYRTYLVLFAHNATEADLAIAAGRLQDN